MEYFGRDSQALSATGMATVCNMGAETGATTSIFPYAPAISELLRANNRSDMAAVVEKVSSELSADYWVEFDQVINLTCSHSSHVSMGRSPPICLLHCPSSVQRLKGSSDQIS